MMKKAAKTSGGSSNNNKAKSEPKQVRILIADDHEAIRQGLRMLVAQHPDWAICGEADNGIDVVNLATKQTPDVVILDLGMPGLGGLEVTLQIKHALPDTEVLIFSAEQNEELIHAVFDAGAKSYIFKTEEMEHLAMAVEALSQHKPYFTPQISEIIFSRYLTTGGGKTTPRTEGISSREREIVKLLTEGKTNKEVSTQLSISVKTVETHRAAIMRKLKLATFADLVRYAIRNRIIEP